MKKFLLTVLSLMAVTFAYAGIAGEYTVFDYAGASVGSDWKMSDAWSINDVEEGYTIEDYYYTVTISEKEDGTYTITNLLGWEETVDATYEDGVLSIAAGTLVDEENEAYIMGGTEKYPTYSQIISYLNSNNTYMYSTQIPKPITFELDEDGVLAMTSPLVIYYPYEGYLGYASDVYSTLKLRPASESVKGIEFDSNAPVEYYNLQGVRIQNPANGQIVIMRQGAKVSKTIVR